MAGALSCFLSSNLTASHCSKVAQSTWVSTQATGMPRALTSLMKAMSTSSTRAEGALMQYQTALTAVAGSAALSSRKPKTRRLKASWFWLPVS